MMVGRRLSRSDVNLLVEDRVDITIVARCVLHHIGLSIIKMQQAVEVVLQSYRDFYTLPRCPVCR